MSKHTSKNRRQQHRMKVRLAFFVVATSAVIIAVHYFAGQSSHELSSMATGELLYALADKGIDVLFFGGAE